MRRLAGAAAGLWVLAAAGLAPGDEAADAFNSLYGEEFRRATATPTAADDVALAQQLLEAAKTAGAQPALLAVLCDKAYELAAKDPSGYPTALAAMDLLGTQIPGKHADGLLRSAAIHQRQYAAARGDAKIKAGETLIQALSTAAAAQAASGDSEGAAATLRQALTVATATRSELKTNVQGQLSALVARQQIEKQVGALKAKLEANPQDEASRKEIVRLCLVELDNPAEAAKFLGAGLDAAALKYVPGAAKPLADAPEVACQELGEWYRGLADQGATYASKDAMLQRAKAYYERFLDLHKTADLARTAATLTLKKIDDTMAKLDEAEAKAGRAHAAPVRKRVVYVEKMSMAPFKTGTSFGPFPVQQTEDPVGPFVGKPVYFNQQTGQDVVYDITWPGRLKEVYYKGAAMTNLTIEVLDPQGKPLAKIGPLGGGNVWAEFTLPLPPNVGPRFILRFRNNAGAWFFINTIELR